MLGKIGRRLVLYRRRGLTKSLKVAVDLSVLSMLRLVFGFHPWHSRSPTSLRPYRAGLAAMASSVRPTTVVEVGCGLGAILSRIVAPVRVGYDIDKRVIRAARVLRSPLIKFKPGGFAEVEETQIDLLVAVNWPHDFSADQVERWLAPLLPRTRYLLLDRIDPLGSEKYDYNHDFAFLAGRAVAIQVESLGEEHREFILFEVTR